MTELSILLAVVNTVLVVLLVLRSKKKNPQNEVASDQMPEWAKIQMEELKEKLVTTEARLDAKEEQLRQDSVKAATTIAGLERDLKNAQASLEQQKEQFEKLREDEQEAKKQMSNEFQVLANKILEEKSKEFKSTNSEELEKLLAPFKQKLADFEKTVVDSHKEELKNAGQLMASIKSLQDMNTQLSEEASGLAKALRGDTKKQGNWGEFVLERALEMSGLTKDKEYFIQNSETTEEGRRLQPDVIIQLPGNKKIIVDSKVSLVSWDDHVNAEDSTAASAAMKSLITSIQTHIKGLSDKDYPQLYGGDTPEFVLLFIPIEAAFMEATKADANLYEYAFSRKIILVSSSTLLATLKTIAMAWRQEKQTKNVLDIAEAGGKLYDKFVGLSQDLDKLGNQFKTAQKTYDEAMNKMVSGRGNLISQVQRLKKLGSKTKKELDVKLVDQAQLGEYSDQANTEETPQ